MHCFWKELRCSRINNVHRTIKKLQYNDAENGESKKLKDRHLLGYVSKPSVTSWQTVSWFTLLNTEHHEQRSFEEKQEFLMQRKQMHVHDGFYHSQAKSWMAHVTKPVKKEGIKRGRTGQSWICLAAFSLCHYMHKVLSDPSNHCSN